MQAHTLSIYLICYSIYVSVICSFPWMRVVTLYSASRDSQSLFLSTTNANVATSDKAILRLLFTYTSENKGEGKGGGGGG